MAPEMEENLESVSAKRARQILSNQNLVLRNVRVTEPLGIDDWVLTANSSIKSAVLDNCILDELTISNTRDNTISLRNGTYVKVLKIDSRSWAKMLIAPNDCFLEKVFLTLQAGSAEIDMNCQQLTCTNNNNSNGTHLTIQGRIENLSVINSLNVRIDLTSGLHSEQIEFEHIRSDSLKINIEANDVRILKLHDSLIGDLTFDTSNTGELDTISIESSRLSGIIIKSKELQEDKKVKCLRVSGMLSDEQAKMPNPVLMSMQILNQKIEKIILHDAELRSLELKNCRVESIRNTEDNQQCSTKIDYLNIEASRVNNVCIPNLKSKIGIKIDRTEISHCLDLHELDIPLFDLHLVNLNTARVNLAQTKIKFDGLSLNLVTWPRGHYLDDPSIQNSKTAWNKVTCWLRSLFNRIENKKRIEALQNLRENYSLLKRKYLQEENKFEASQFLANEQHSEKRIKFRQIFGLSLRGLSDWLILVTNDLFSRYGQSWLRPLFWWVIIHSVILSYVYCRLDYGYEPFFVKWHIDLDNTIEGAKLFFQLMIPFHDEDALKTDTSAQRYLVDTFIRVYSAYFLFQFIRGTRKYNF